MIVSERSTRAGVRSHADRSWVGRGWVATTACATIVYYYYYSYYGEKR